MKEDINRERDLLNKREKEIQSALRESYKATGYFDFVLKKELREVRKAKKKLFYLKVLPQIKGD